VILRARVGNAEIEADAVEKAGLGQGDAPGREIIANVKNQPVGAGNECRVFEQRSVAAAVGVGHPFDDGLRLVAAEERDPDARPGTAVGEIEDMGRQPAHGGSVRDPDGGSVKSVASRWFMACYNHMMRESEQRPIAPVSLTPLPRTMSRAGFVAAYGAIYEDAPWVAEAAWDQGLGPAEDTAAGLHAALAAVVAAAGRERQLALLRAHPELGVSDARAGSLGAHSRAEQAGAGLDACTARELARFQALNAAYRAHFGFPFIIAVRGRGRAEILAVFEHRLNNDPAVERAAALTEVDRIAAIRLGLFG